MTRTRTPLAALLVVLLLTAGCLGASGGSAPANDSATATTGGPTDVTAGPVTTAETSTATTTPGVDCPDNVDRYRRVAVEYVAEQSGADPANVSVVNDAFVDYPILGECYYHAKVQNSETGRVSGVYVAENGTVADRETVETRADRAYEREYGNLSRDLYRRMQSADADERISVVVSVADVNQTAVKQAVDRRNLTGEEYKRALSEEYERRAEAKTQAVVAELREIDGVTGVEMSPLRVRVRATPAAIEKIQRLDRVTWLDLREETTTYVSGTTASEDA